MGKKKRAASAAVAISARRSAKREHRRQEKRKIAAEMWAAPAPPGLVAKLDAPKIKSKYHSYFEFAENTEKKKKLEYQVTDNASPPPGFEFVPIGNPELTNACKELSREQDAMIFIVSGSKETNLRISDHVFRKGFHFRSTIVEEARRILGETIGAEKVKSLEHIEPIPESQEEINKQADAAIRDLFPRIPNTDRQLIIQHAFQKGVLFHGEATVGLQPDIPLWRRVQLAVVAHIRHNHTRYDKLLRETSWMNARKAVEPVCLDVLVKWRGDEETGRDQLDEILREVVVITDSEDEDASSEEDTSEEEDNLPQEVQTREQPQLTLQHQSQPTSSELDRSLQQMRPNGDNAAADSVIQRPRLSSRARSKVRPVQTRKDKRAQRGFKRYQAAWEQAVNRQREGLVSSAPRPFVTSNDSAIIPTHRPIGGTSTQETVRHTPDTVGVRSLRASYYEQNSRRTFDDTPTLTLTRPEPYYPERKPAEATLIQRNEVNVHPLTERRKQYRDETTYVDAAQYIPREQERLPVFRRSPPRHGLQDMLVPSIESPSVGGAPVLQPRRVDSPQESYISYDRQPMPIRRQVVQTRRKSPPPQVIIISDDSPKVKRPRLLYEEDNGHFRPAHTNDGSSFIAMRSEASPRSSITLAEPQTQRQAFPPSNQGLFHGSQTSMSSSFIPMQDSRYHHSGNGAILRHSDQIRGAEHNSNFNPRGEVPSREDQSYQRIISNDREHFYSRPADHHNVRVIERGELPRREQFDFSPREHTTRPISPTFPVSDRISRSHEMRTGPVVADQAFIHRFSQSRLQSAVPESREDSFVVLPPQRSHRSFVAQRVDPRPYPEQTHRFLPAPSGQHWDTEQHPSNLSQAVYPGRLPMEAPPSVSREQDLYTPRGGPVYVRPTPRQQVIVLD